MSLIENIILWVTDIMAVTVAKIGIALTMFAILEIRKKED